MGRLSDRRQRGLEFGAYVVYQTAAVLFFGIPLLSRFATEYAGSGPDPQFMLWSVAWWPYALSHRLNPLFTHLLWAPEGFNLAWSTSNLLQGLAITPVTLRFGPVVGLNVLQLMMPALTAWTAFRLIRDLTANIGAALVGGYLFGFSPFIIGHQMGAHLFASGAFLIPAGVHLTLKQLQGSLKTRSFVLGLTLLLVCQFLMGLELLATAVMFGTIALGVAWLLWRDWRAEILRTETLILIAIGSAALVLSPILISTLIAGGMGRHRVWADNGVDLFEVLAPGHAFLIGELLGLDRVSAAYAHFSHDLGGYVGLPVATVAGLFFGARLNQNQPRRLFFAVMVAIVYVAALGPSLHFRGRELIVMPWKLIDGLPFLNSAQSARFTVYLDLLLAIIVAIWISETQLQALAKIGIAALIVVSVMPNFLDQSLWVTDPRMPGFFASGQYESYLKPGGNALILPYGPKGQSMAWQALSGMYFAMPEGWTGPTPHSFAAWPIMDVFNYGVDIPEEQLQLDAFLGAHDVTAVVIDRNAREFADSMSLIDPAKARVEVIDGVVLARFSSESLEPFRQTTATQMQCRLDDARLGALIAAADRYIKAGYPMDRLTPGAAEDHGLLPARWVESEDRGVFTRAGIGLGPADANRVMVEVATAAQCATTLAEKYRASAAAILFPAPHPWGTKRLSAGRGGKLEMVFARDRLEAASSLSRRAAGAR